MTFKFTKRKSTVYFLDFVLYEENSLAQSLSIQYQAETYSEYRLESRLIESRRSYEKDGKFDQLNQCPPPPPEMIF